MSETTDHTVPAEDAIVQIRDFDFYYGSFQAVFNVNMNILPRQVTALIGPSGCGKSTLLRCLNRMNDLIDSARYDGDILIDDENIFAPGQEVISLRQRVGMVFQRSNPFPKSIYENVIYGLRLTGAKSGSELDDTVEHCLRGAALWDEVKDRLGENAMGLSGGQMQRLCIARAMAVEPEIILMDEPCSALDPIATSKIEETILELRKEYTIIIVTHNMQQASRVSDRTAFMLNGYMVEYAPTEVIFENPQEEKTEEYTTGRFG